MAYKATERHSPTMSPTFDQRRAVAAFGDSSTSFTYRT